MNAFSVRQVFDWNYETEFAALLESVDVAGSLVAFDIKFPGLMCDTPWCVSREEQYEVIHGNVNFLQPSQIVSPWRARMEVLLARGASIYSAPTSAVLVLKRSANRCKKKKVYP